MLNSEIINNVSYDIQNDELLGLQKWKTEYIIKAYLSELAKEIKNGNDIKIEGFGTFTQKYVKGGSAINIHTGKEMVIKDKKYIYFRPSKKLK